MTDYFAGIDVGASTTKSVIIDISKKIISFHITKTGADFKRASEICYNESLKIGSISRDEIKFIISTGYGRYNVNFANQTKTEISCHAKGAYFYFPKAITIIDIGGQDTKIIKLDKNGKRISFKMNRKCAAGTGTFLEEIANRLDTPLNKLDSLARNADKNIKLNSFCTVFASTEILSKIKEGESRENMVKGAFDSVIKRILEMDSLNGEVVLTGGVIAHNSIISEILKNEFNVNINIPSNPQIIGAYGAALFALNEYISDI